MFNLYAIGYYFEEDKSSRAVAVIPSNNEDEAWWKAQCYMSEMLGQECGWITPIKNLDDAKYWINRCESEKYQC